MKFAKLVKYLLLIGAGTTPNNKFSWPPQPQRSSTLSFSFSLDCPRDTNRLLDPTMMSNHGYYTIHCRHSKLESRHNFKQCQKTLALKQQ